MRRHATCAQCTTEMTEGESRGRRERLLCVIRSDGAARVNGDSAYQTEPSPRIALTGWTKFLGGNKASSHAYTA